MSAALARAGVARPAALPASHRSSLHPARVFASSNTKGNGRKPRKAGSSSVAVADVATPLTTSRTPEIEVDSVLEQELSSNGGMCACLVCTGVPSAQGSGRVGVDGSA